VTETTRAPARDDGGRQRRVLHMIGNSHIDPVWLWQWPEGYQEVRATFRSALDRMNEYPEFLFTADSAAYYAWVEEIDPDMFEEIRRRVDEGRWEIVGGWWIEPDCNLPSGESFVRHALVSQRYFESRFGRMATVGYNVDPFGHSGMLPQILRRSGMDAYVFMRPGPHEKALPSPVFWWESADGSRVLAMRLPHEYCSPREDLGHHLDKSLAQLPERWDEMMVFYGVGNHGGGPTRDNLESIRALDRSGSMPQLLHSTPTRFFDRIRETTAATLPVVRDDLQHHGVGCYSAHSGIKRWNRRAEGLLGRAEAWAAIGSWVTGQPYPLEDFERAWKQVLFNQFHDILAGTSIEPAYEEARDQLGEASAVAARAENAAIQSISRRITIPDQPGTAPIVVFNPHAWPLRTVVETEFGGLKATDGLVDDHDRRVPFQPTQSFATVSAWRSRMAIVVDLPALGYQTYRVVPDTPRVVDGPVRATDASLENEQLRLELDPMTGRIVALDLLDEGPAVDLADPSRPRAVVVDDTSDTWGHRRAAYRDDVGAFEASSVTLVEHGPARAIVRVTSRFGRSELVEDFVLSAGDRAVEVRVILDWREQAKLLKLRFPTRLSATVAAYEIPYGVIERPANGDEEPGQRWVDVSGRVGKVPAGLAVLNDGKYAFDVLDDEIGVTAVRSPIFAHHEPRIPTPGIRYSFQDQGIQRFTLALLPHRGGWADAGLTRRAMELNQRPTVLLESYHDGPLPQAASYASVEPEGVVLGAVKLAEDGSADLVLRVVETAGRGGPAVVDLPALGRRVELDIGPFEIRTFRVPRDGDAEVLESDLLERLLGEDGRAVGTT
jgi:alpha-mannosidase